MGLKAVFDLSEPCEKQAKPCERRGKPCAEQVKPYAEHAKPHNNRAKPIANLIEFHDYRAESRQKGSEHYYGTCLNAILYHKRLLS